MASDAREREGYLFLSLLQARAGGSVIRRVPDGDVGSLLQRPGEELARAMGLGEKASRALVEIRRGFDAGAVIGCLAREDFRAVTYGEEAYPGRLKVAPDPPPALFVGGELGGGTTVALVGSRRATRSGLETARVLGRALAARGVCVVSGLAAGVDAAAHEGALAAGGETVGVLGCGVDVVYPRENRELFRRVREGARSSSSITSGRPRSPGVSRRATGSSPASPTPWSSSRRRRRAGP